jgi:hypothetical protein
MTFDGNQAEYSLLSSIENGAQDGRSVAEHAAQRDQFGHVGILVLLQPLRLRVDDIRLGDAIRRQFSSGPWAASRQSSFLFVHTNASLLLSGRQIAFANLQMQLTGYSMRARNRDSPGQQRERRTPTLES